MNFNHKSYVYNNFKFQNFIDLSEDDLLEALSWRNNINARKWMRNTDLISNINHLDYCKDLINNNYVGHWILSDKSRKIGVISMNAFYKEENSCEWGYYLSDKSFPEDFLLIFHCALLFFFEILSVSLLHGSIKVENKNAIILNSFFNFSESELKIFNNEVYSLRSLSKEDWQLNQKALSDLLPDFHKFFKLNK